MICVHLHLVSLVMQDKLALLLRTPVTNGTNDVKAEAALDVSTHESAAAAIKTINDAIEKVSSECLNLGAVQNRLEHTISNLKQCI